MTRFAWKYDLKSSFVVFLVALPLCLGIALASGAPVSAGIISGVIGGVVVGLLGPSHISVSGPAAGLTVIVATGITDLGSFQRFGLAVFIAGLIQILFFALRGGVIGDYFPTAVIKGMLAAIGLILIFKELPYIVGLSSAPHSFDEINGGIVGISVLSLGLMLGWDAWVAPRWRLLQFVPGALVAVVSSVALNAVFNLAANDLLVHLPTSLFENWALPSFSSLDWPVLKLAITIAIIASLETLLCIDAADKIDPYGRRTNKNRELLAQGVGNALAGLVGGLPVTAVIVRSTANVAAGARTKYSAVLHGMWLLLCVTLVPGFLNLIPMATLACVLLLVGFKLTKPALYKEMWGRGPDQFLIFLTTIGVILATDLLVGITVGFVLALLLDLRRPALSCFEVIDDGDQVRVTFFNNASFFHRPALARAFSQLPPERPITIVGMAQVRVHVDVREFVNEFMREAKKKNRYVDIS